MQFFRRRRRINLALQGGGAHGAFTWGVLDRLLEDATIEIGWISATSAGAVNAVAIAAGLAEAGHDGARAKLEAIWAAVQQAGVPDLIRLNPFLAGISRSNALAQVASLFSPYDFNPLGFDPLRRLLAERVDFAMLRTNPGPELLIAATEVATGRARLFRRAEITVEAVLASACLPTLHHAVTIDGIAYWDGGFSANPDIMTIVRESPVGDTLIVQLNPLEKSGTPTGAREIAGHVSQLTFNQPFLREVELIATLRDLSRGRWGRGSGLARRLARHRFHLIEAGRYTVGLAADSKGKPEQALLAYLRDAGRSEADKWMARNLASVGRRSTVDLGTHVLDVRRRRELARAEAESIAQRAAAAAPQDAATNSPDLARNAG